MLATLELITHDGACCPLTHGFFTRRGGASSGIFSGLNCGQGSSDLSEAVAVNRDRVAQSLGLPATALARRSSDALRRTSITVDHPLGQAAQKADALVTDTARHRPVGPDRRLPAGSFRRCNCGRDRRGPCRMARGAFRGAGQHRRGHEGPWRPPRPDYRHHRSDHQPARI
jgi:hypothetical protein